MRCRRHSTLLLQALLISLCMPVVRLPYSQAQITLDGSVGPAGVLRGPHYTINAAHGQLRGSNLFHSFAEFNVHGGESATFTGPPAVENVIGRVTGGNASFIDGQLRSEMPKANLYLLNPNGVMFGPNASLDVKGSFHVSTADYVKLADGAEFQADLGKGSVLSAAPPEAFGFLSSKLAEIDMQGSFLEVPAGKTLSVVGGDIDIKGGFLSVPGGHVNVASVASPGEAVFRDAGFAVDSFQQFGELRLSAGASIDVSGEHAGSIAIQGGRLVMNDATIQATTEHSRGGGITVDLTDELVATNGAAITTASVGNGEAGDIALVVGSLTLNSASGVFSMATGAGNGGSIRVTARESVEISNLSDISSIALGRGDSGNISITTPALSMSEEGFIDARTIGDGNAGDVKIEVERLTLTGGSQIGSGSGIASIETGETFVGKGQAGNVWVTATDSIAISGRSSLGIESGIFTQTAALCEGAACGPTTSHEGTVGLVSIETPSLVLTDGARIGTDTASDMRGGDVRITVGSVSVESGAQISSESGIAVGETLVVGRGRGGDVQIEAVEISLRSGGTISAKSLGTGDAGDIAIHADETFHSDGGLVTTDAQSAQGGQIAISARRMVQLTGDTKITTSVANDAGDAGKITIAGDIAREGDDPTRFVIIRPAEYVVLDGKILATAVEGRGGNIEIAASQAYLASTESETNVRSARGISGQVDVQAPVTEMSGTFAPLPETFLDVAELLRERCGEQVERGKSGRFVVEGRDGIPMEPGSFLPSPFPLNAQLNRPTGFLGTALSLPVAMPASVAQTDCAGQVLLQVR